MTPQSAQLVALAAVIDHGTFDAAASALQVTPSAISQRIRALETMVGQVLVVRAAPCRPTPAGERLVRVARQVQLLYDEVASSWDDQGVSRVDLAIAVSADSLATWLRPVLGEVATWAGVALRLHVEDQAFSADLLRRGEVLAAITSEPTPVQGCRSTQLGRLRYTPAASPELAARWRRGRGPDWAAMPMVVFNQKDQLQHDVLARHGVGAPPVVHRVPTSADFLEAVRAGLGWGAIPDPQLLPDLEAGRLVRLTTRDHLDVPLHWQSWRLGSSSLDRLADAVRRAAAASLRPPVAH